MTKWIAIALVSVVICGCAVLTVTAVRPGLYAAVGDDPEEAIKTANKFCRRDEHKTIAVAKEDVGSVVDKSNENNGKPRVTAGAGNMAFNMNGGKASFQFSCE